PKSPPPASAAPPFRLGPRLWFLELSRATRAVALRDAFRVPRQKAHLPERIGGPGGEIDDRSNRSRGAIRGRGEGEDHRLPRCGRPLRRSYRRRAERRSFHPPPRRVSCPPPARVRSPTARRRRSERPGNGHPTDEARGRDAGPRTSRSLARSGGPLRPSARPSPRARDRGRLGGRPPGEGQPRGRPRNDPPGNRARLCGPFWPLWHPARGPGAPGAVARVSRTPLRDEDAPFEPSVPRRARGRAGRGGQSARAAHPPDRADALGGDRATRDDPPRGSA